MKYLKISNLGVLDIRLVALMGGTTKKNDQYKIGKFGTGLKYTIAWLCRNNVHFRIFCGPDEVVITTKAEVIAGTSFEIIYINGERSSITTGMGLEWEAWMIIRELWCNALDEGGAHREVSHGISSPPDDRTTFCIQIVPDIQRVLDNWHKYFIHDSTPIYASSEVALYPAGDTLCIYKQGVLIKELKDQKSIFSYDFKTAPLNELREYNESVSKAITLCLIEANEDAARYFLENVTDEHYEGDTADYNWFRSFGEPWQRAIGSAKLIYQKVLDDIKKRGNTPDESKYLVVPEVVYKALTRTFKGVGALDVVSDIQPFYEMLSSEMHGRVIEAVKILGTIGYTMPPNINIKYGHFTDPFVHAQADVKSRTIYISNDRVNDSVFSLLTMLVEEGEHIATGMHDKTREFQQHFINKWVRSMLKSSGMHIVDKNHIDAMAESFDPLF
jgi:hypothetical protein